jgi:hypothetical protein
MTAAKDVMHPGDICIGHSQRVCWTQHGTCAISKSVACRSAVTTIACTESSPTATSS